MIRSLNILALWSLLSCVAIAQQSPIPAEVMVATEPTMAKEFSLWAETDLSKYEGTFSGDVGGDSSGKLIFKLGKAKQGEFPVYASGSYSQTPAGSAATSVKFENAAYYGDMKGVFAVGAFNIVFVKHGKIPGVIVGNIFIPKA